MSQAAVFGTNGSVSFVALRPLVGNEVVIETADGTTRARLLSCVRDSAWFVSGDTDLVLQLDEIRSVRGC